MAIKTKEVRGTCCNCKRDFSYSPEICVDLVCMTCASGIPTSIRAYARERCAVKTMRLIREFVNNYASDASPESLRVVLTGLLDLGDYKMPKDI